MKLAALLKVNGNPEIQLGHENGKLWFCFLEEEFNLFGEPHAACYMSWWGMWPFCSPCFREVCNPAWHNLL